MKDRDLMKLLTELDSVDDPEDDQAAVRLLQLAAVIEEWHSCVCRIECGVIIQDANYAGEIELSLSNSFGTWPAHIRASWFGKMITIIDPKKVVDATKRRTLKELFDGIGYQYVPVRQLRRPYPGTDYGTWFDRYFGY